MQVVNNSFKMVKTAAKWRESASLIIAARDGTNAEDGFDYKVLLFNRSANASFMPTTSVFPGGVCEAVDESPSWLKYFKTVGLHEDQLQKLILKRDPNLKPVPGIFHSQEGERLHKDLSLRITAIRETFEEMGILLCRDSTTPLENRTKFGYFREDFDRKHWQHLVHNDASQFLRLCQELNVVPDFWSLREWSAWLTPAVYKKRFSTAFYLVTLQKKPHVILEENEGIDYVWMSPKDAIIANMNRQLFLGPPQFFELSRLLNFSKILQLQEFAYQRAGKGTILLLPVQRLCSDGLIILLPGDSNYPCDPNETCDLETIDMTKEQHRSNAKKLHRIEPETFNFGMIHISFEPIDGHLKPINLTSNAKL